MKSHCYAANGAVILVPNKNVTFTNGINIVRAGVQSGSRSRGVVLDGGEHVRVTFAAYA